MTDRPTFSPFWHRVRTMKPRLRPHVQITRQRYRGRRWHVVHDPASNQFYRLNPIAYDFVAMLDGVRGVETAWKISLGKFGDSAPTQNEVIQLLGQLYNSNLLAVDSSPETEQLLRRGRDRLKKKIQQQAIGIMYFRIRLFNPDRMLTALEPIFRPLLNRWGLLAWAALVVAALTQVLPKWDVLVERFDASIAPANWPWIAVVFVVTKAIHEMGHGLICKRFGGQVPEFGAMLLVLFPAPYVDASSCWAFPSKWRRMAVGAGGMIFELAVASIAAFVWARGSRGELITQLAYNAMLTASVSTVLFNANPLMRFDGYYMLADLLETPNLAQRSNSLLKFLIQKYIYLLKQVTPPSSLRGEQIILFLYGIVAGAYRIFLFISITLLVMGKLFIIGVLLAIWTAAAWFIVPVGVFLHWLATSPQLSEHRPRAVLTSAALIGGLLIVLGVIPMPDHRRGMGVIESRARTGVFFGTEGFVVQANARPGQTVKAGDPIVTLESNELLQSHRALRAQIDEFSINERQARQREQPAVAQVEAERAAVLSQTLADVERRIAGLIVRAPHDGVVAGADPVTLVGSYVHQGDPVCVVVDTANIRIAASMDQQHGGWLHDPSLKPEDYTVQIRLVSALQADPIDGTNVDPEPAGRRYLPDAALSAPGGGTVELDPQDRSGHAPKRNRFTVYVDPVFTAAKDRPGEPVWRGLPGERVRLRFTLPARPLLDQWLDRLRLVIQGRPQV